MERRKFIKGSAIVGAGVVLPEYLQATSGLIGEKENRTVNQVLTMEKEMVGTLPILRAFAGDHQDLVSPFVLFDEFGPVKLSPGSEPLRVNAHPHAGIIPTTFFLSGSGHHRDSLKYDFQIAKGDFMMFNSGKGAVHMEETGKKLKEDGGVYHGFQIWLNLPKAYKFSTPTTAVYNAKNMALVKEKNFHGEVVLGQFGAYKSSIPLVSPAFYFHFHLNAGCKMVIPTDPTHNAMVYSIKGNIETTDQRNIKQNQVALFDRGKSEIPLFSKEPSEILVLGGRPLNEPVFSYGPFVMNTEQEIQQCIQNYRSGKMGNPDEVDGRN